MRLLLLILIPSIAWADPLRISQMRLQVEALADEIESQRKEDQATIDAYIQRRQEIQTLLLRERFKAQQLAAQKKRLDDELKKRNLSGVATIADPGWLSPLLDRLDSEIGKGLPLPRPKRELLAIKTALSKGKTTLESALVQTWFVIDEALRFRTTTEYLISTLTAESVETPAEIARFGDLLAYVRTSEGAYGVLSWDESRTAWSLQTYEDRESQTQIAKLLEQFKQNQKTGLFALPGLTSFTSPRQSGSPK